MLYKNINLKNPLFIIIFIQNNVRAFPKNLSNTCTSIELKGIKMPMKSSRNSGS